MESSRLEAIMFTDIAGYSRLMDEDEDRTIALLRRHNEIVLPVIEADSGHVIDAIGDGLLVTFPSVRKAVSCGVTIHQRINQHNEAAAEDERFKLRIGVHLGEIRHEEGRVFGTGVNIAARVQQYALPGGVCITEDVFRQIERRIPQTATSIGRHTLRNISRPYELFRVETGFESDEAGSTPTVEGAGIPEPGGLAAAVPAKQAGELDEVKEKILSEIGKWSDRSQDRDPESREARIESKVYSVVERVMDKALDKWDKMPDEKKSNIIHKINVEIDSGGDKKKKKEKDSEKPSNIAGSIVWGAVATGAAAFWYTQVPGAWPIILGLFVGVFPLMSGFTNLIKRSIKRRDRIAKPAVRDDRALEGQVLKAAKELGGRVTVVQIAAHTGHPLDEVQTTLENMARRGYVSLEVLESGVVRYDFPSLLPEHTDSDPIA